MQLNQKTTEERSREERAQLGQERGGTRRSDEGQLLIAQLKAQSGADQAEAEKTATELLRSAKEKRAQEPVGISDSPASPERVAPEEADPPRVKRAIRRKARRPSGSPASEAPQDS